MDALRKLSELEYKHRYQESTLPDYARFRKKFSAKSANALTQSIITWIRLHGGHAERVNVQGRPLDQTRVVSNSLGQRHMIGSISWIPSTGTKGSSDIHSVINGKSIFIEVKVGKDRLSEHQKQYRDNVTSAGAVYFVARDFDSFVEFYNNLND